MNAIKSKPIVPRPSPASVIGRRRHHTFNNTNMMMCLDLAQAFAGKSPCALRQRNSAGPWRH
jgi:hypothetical protein